MADTTGGAYVGYPKQPATPRNEEAAARLAALLRGFTGEDKPDMSVLDPNYASAAEMSNVGRIAGLASDVPSPKSVIPMLGMMLPYIKGLRGISGLQNKAFEEAATKAGEMLRSGKGASETGRATNMWLIPQGGDRQRLSMLRPHNGSFMIEVPDSNFKYNPKILDAKGNVPQFDAMPLYDAIDAPNIKRLAPELKDTTVYFKQGKNPGGGAFDPNTNTISIESQGIPHQDLDTIQHELQHRFQYPVDKSGIMPMPGGGNPGMFRDIGAWNSVTGGLERAAQVMQSIPDANKALAFNDQLRQGADSPFRGYRALLGEQQANATTARRGMSPAERKAITPYESYEFNPLTTNDGINPADLISYINELGGGKVTQQEAIANLIRRLRTPVQELRDY